MRTIPTLALVCLLLPGCASISNSGLNPLNWFGGEPQVAPTVDRSDVRPLVDPGDLRVVVDSRPLIARVDGVQVDRRPGGAIVTATGIAPSQGYFNAELVRRGRTGGTLIYEFRVQEPAGFEAVGPLPTRQITVSDTVTDAELGGIGTIRVLGGNGAREARP